MVALGASAALVGCAARAPASAGPAPGARAERAGTWDQVFLAAGEGDAPPEAPAWATTRRDGALAVHAPEPLLATAQWPEPARASLEHRRIVTFPRRADSMIFFLSERRGGLADPPPGFDPAWCPPGSWWPGTGPPLVPVYPPPPGVLGAPRPW